MTVAACAALVERGDRDRFLSAMAAPVEARRILFPLYAFNLEIARAPWLTAEPLIAEMRLQWWHDALEEIRSGGPVRRHEVTTPLAEVIDPEAAALLDAAITARRWDIGAEPFDGAEALWRHLDATAGTLMWVAARMLGAPDAAEPVVRDVAAAQGLASWFEAVPALIAAGKRPLPESGNEAIGALAKDGLRRLASARRSRAKVPASASPALLAAWCAGPLLRQAARDPLRVMEPGLGLSEFSRRARLLAAALTGRW